MREIGECKLRGQKHVLSLARIASPQVADGIRFTTAPLRRA
jgi:hypothetical protein